MIIKVAKFGGSSMADAGQYRKVRDIILADESRKVVVVSAAGKRTPDDHKITDLLYLCYAHQQYGVDCGSVFKMITDRYLEIRDELKLDLDLESDFARIKQDLDGGRLTQDALVSRGEYYSAKLMAAYLGFRFVDAVDWVKFDLDGSVDEDASYSALQKAMDRGGIVTPGFYGILPDGNIRTFSRGGSDITGALAAAALEADIYENWTDVSGILMADPRIVDDPLPIAQVTYDELRQLSHSGAQVLHEGTIAPVRAKNIAVNIRNTNDPAHPGTMIRESFPADSNPDRFITGITGRKDYTVITLFRRGMSSDISVLCKLLSILERHGLSVEHTPNGVDNVSVVISAKSISPCLYTVLDDIRQEVEPDNLVVTQDIAMIAAVGRRMAARPGISGKLFGALGEAGVNIRIISQGPEELNIIFGVDNKDFSQAIRVLYNSFAK